MAPPLCTQQLNNSLLAATYNNHNHLIMASTTTAANANPSPPSARANANNCDEESAFVTIAHHLMQQQQQQHIGHDQHQFSPNYNCEPNHHHNNNYSFYSNSHSSNPAIFYPFTPSHVMDHPPYYFSNWGAPHDDHINTNTNYNNVSSNCTWQHAKSNMTFDEDHHHRHHHGGENQETIASVNNNNNNNNNNGCFHSSYVPDDEDEEFDHGDRDDDGHHVMIETVPISHASSPLLLIDQSVLNPIDTEIPNHPDYIYNSSSSSSSLDESASALHDKVITDHKDTTTIEIRVVPPTMATDDICDDTDPSNCDGQLLISTSLTRSTSAGIYNNDSSCNDQSLSTMTMDQIYNFGGLVSGCGNNSTGPGGQSDHGMFHREASGRLNTMMQVNRTQSDDVIEALLLKPASRSGSGISNCLDWLESLMELEAHEHVDDINAMDTHQYDDGNRNIDNDGLLDDDEDEEDEDHEEEDESDDNRQGLNLGPMVNAIGFVNNNSSSTNEGMPLAITDLQEGSGPYTCMDEDELDGQVNMADGARLLLDDDDDDGGDNKKNNVTNSGSITSHGSVSPVSTTTTTTTTTTAATATNGVNGHHHPEAAVSVHGVELLQLLLECAKCVDSDPCRSIALLPKLRSGSTRHGDPIQRLTSYFTEALSCRLARRLKSSHELFFPPPPPPTGSSSRSSSCSQNIHDCMGNPGGRGDTIQDEMDILKSYNSAATDTLNDGHELAMAYKAMNDACPYFTFAQLTANQAILETMLQMEYLSDAHLLQQFLHSRQSSPSSCPNININSSSKNSKNRYDIHIVDFGISQGVQWAALLQAMANMEVDSSSSSSSCNAAECAVMSSRGGGGESGDESSRYMIQGMKVRKKVEESSSRRGRKKRRRIKITGIASPELGQRWEEAVEATGRRLVEFGASMEVEVEFKKAKVALGDERLSLEMVGVEEGEVVVVNFMLELSNVLEGGAVSRVLSLAAALRPKLVTLAELDAHDLNTAPFQRRFVSALHFFSAMFDSLEASPMARDSPQRLCMERRLLGRRIVSMVGGPDDPGGPRRRLLSFADWHAAMSSAGFRPSSLGVYAADQARILLLRFTYCQSFTLTERLGGAALSLGWLHKPLLTVSAWTL